MSATGREVGGAPPPGRHLRLFWQEKKSSFIFGRNVTHVKVASRHAAVSSVFLSRRTLVLFSSSHCAALSLSLRAVWLLRRPSSRRHLVLSSSSHSQRHSRRPRRWRSLSPAAPDIERCRRGGPRHRVTVALNIALDAVSCPPTLSP